MKLRELPIEELVSMYQSGASSEEVGAHFGTSGKSVRFLLAKAGVPRRKAVRRPHLFPPRVPADRFSEKYTIEPNTGCWLWTAGLNNAGYGMFAVSKHDIRLAHRWFYEISTGSEVSAILDLDHLCRVRCCVNPRHLEPVSRSENLRRGFNLNKQKTKCIHGHPLSGGNLLVDKKGRRKCLTCQRKYAEAYRLKRRV